ncbi:MAG: type IA DNA topoisomerase [Lachnospiraceae bacterium]|nr:type IA DNA topoisomerase [Lachnospiraceae bacterium]
MGKNLFIAEKPSVAKEFAKALKLNTVNKDGYMESDDAIVTWCVGHLVTMSYPDAYDEKYKKWSFDTLPFIPSEGTWKYEIIASVKKQFSIVKELLTREDVETIYVCTDSGREGEYIYRLVDQEAHVDNKIKKRVWIDSQTEEEINRGIREAKDISAYDNLAAAAYLRAKEDYLMGINFSRALTLKYGYSVKEFLNKDKAVISVGRVMTCVLGMVVERENEIRKFVETPFFKVLATLPIGNGSCKGEWRVCDTSKYFDSPKLYSNNGFKEKADAEDLISSLDPYKETDAKVLSVEKKKEVKNPPLLFNLAELQNECSKLFKISPDETLNVVQELYEKKLCTYPRTDARVLSSAVAKEIYKNLNGLTGYPPVADYARLILDKNGYAGIAKSKYVDDKQITDHYAIIPTGQGLNNLNSLSDRCKNVYEVITRRFIAIFLSPAIYKKINLLIDVKCENFAFNFKATESEGYLKIMNYSFSKKKEDDPDKDKDDELKLSPDDLEKVTQLKKGSNVCLSAFEIKEGKTSPPKRYNSGSMILAMENAGKLIEDEELREQIKDCGIGTSATRAEILKKLVNIGYLNLNKKTQILTPTQMGEMIFCVVLRSIPQLLSAKLTASWETGLNLVSKGEITNTEYMTKMDDFVSKYTNHVKEVNKLSDLKRDYAYVAQFYK